MTLSRNTVSVLLFMVLVAGLFMISSFARADCFGAGGNCGLNIDLHGNVVLTANPETISAGEPSYLHFTLFMSDQCVANFPFTLAYVEHEQTQYCLDNGGNQETCTTLTGTGTVYPTETTTYTVTCRDIFSEYEATQHTHSSSATVTVATPTQADLIPGATTVSANPRPDVPVTLTASVTNFGSSPANNFPNIFQIENGSLLSAQTLSLTATGGANDSGTITANHTFTTTGIYRVRACADNSTSWVGVVDESDEENNCSDWVAIEIETQCSDEEDNDGDLRFDLDDPGCANDPDGDNESANTPVASLSCTPSNCTGPSGTVSLNYSCTNSTSATLSTFTSPLSPFPSGVKTAPSAGPYQLTCTGPGGTNTTSKTVVFTNATAYIEATPDRVNSGGNSTLGFSASQISSSCTVTGPDGTIWSSPNPIVGGTLATTTAPSGKITRQSTFTISCDGGTVTDSVLVNIVPQFDEF